MTADCSSFVSQLTADTQCVGVTTLQVWRTRSLAQGMREAGETAMPREPR